MGMVPTKSRDRPRVLMVGYNGANNTGAEALLLSDVADVRAVLGAEAQVTIPALNEPNLQRYLHEGPYLDIFPMPMVFPLAARRLVRAHDLILLVEGSTYMDTWTSALLWTTADDAQALAAGIDRAIAEANTHLSHPEQVKR